MNKQQFNKTIETIINSPRSDLQKINRLQNAFALYVKEETDRIVAELEEKSDDIPVQYEDNYEKGFDDGIGYAIEIVRRVVWNEKTNKNEVR